MESQSATVDKIVNNSLDSAYMILPIRKINEDW